MELDRTVVLNNIRTLSLRHGNVSEICRQLLINRQQFNKYLAGQHFPSRSNLTAISDFFGISFEELANPNLQTGGTAPVLSEHARLLTAEPVASLLASSDSRWLGSLVGTYEKYHYSSIYRGDVVRSLLRITERNGIFVYSNYEAFPGRTDPGHVEFTFRYAGVALGISGRLFLMDFERLQSNELTFSIFAPVVRKPMRFLVGVTSGIAADAGREPYCSKAVLDFRGNVRPTRQLVRRASVIPPDDPTIPVEVSQHITPQ
jgi:transcriptional regulator with XRE-family HTH domain